MSLFRRLRDALGLNEEYEEYYYEEDPPSEEVYLDDPPPRRRASSGNVIGLPGLMMEVVLMQPRSFEEIPEAVTALRERKAVILNLNYIEIEQAQRCADYVAGGAFAIDGHQRQIDENVFLFTPNFVQISQHQSPEPELPPSPPPFEMPPSPWEMSPRPQPQREFDARF
ncbi:cell division protein SepF [Thermocoleostomius sinensis]|jgi:cell division inhibitor SepF|uniref:Cell division protein SepF n=1 Tax=Thermocoleostomius sinensis A174 TaxID=2016057 RepID=A0A9E8ZA62_9CYAN|nr:cell division protein SepF [Thermocoleostomius sinensis]WAL59380.1 cell division protein SepF [Thermocoleostomius sinensis A174]